MSFSEAIQTCFSKYATFTGRARRSEYWYFVLFNFVVNTVISVVFGTLLHMQRFQLIISLVWALAVLLPGLAVCWRRMHDIGKSGAYVLLALIPLVGAILLIIWFCKDSQPGENQYGPNPKEAGPEQLADEASGF